MEGTLALGGVWTRGEFLHLLLIWGIKWRSFQLINEPRGAPAAKRVELGGGNVLFLVPSSLRLLEAREGPRYQSFTP